MDCAVTHTLVQTRVNTHMGSQDGQYTQNFTQRTEIQKRHTTYSHILGFTQYTITHSHTHSHSHALDERIGAPAAVLQRTESLRIRQTEIGQRLVLHGLEVERAKEGLRGQRGACVCVWE
jgi:hypothetical protein